MFTALCFQVIQRKPIRGYLYWLLEFQPCFHLSLVRTPCPAFLKGWTQDSLVGIGWDWCIELQYLSVHTFACTYIDKYKHELKIHMNININLDLNIHFCIDTNSMHTSRKHFSSLTNHKPKYMYLTVADELAGAGGHMSLAQTRPVKPCRPSEVNEWYSVFFLIYRCVLGFAATWSAVSTFQSQQFMSNLPLSLWHLMGQKGCQCRPF